MRIIDPKLQHANRDALLRRSQEVAAQRESERLERIKHRERYIVKANGHMTALRPR